jgi:hypothetical protein
MITTRAFPTDVEPSTITVHFVLQDDTGAGIVRVTVTDRDGVRIDATQPRECPPIWEFDIGPIARTRLPLFVEAEDCARRVTPVERTGPLLMKFGVPIDPGPMMPCSPEVDCPPTTTACNVATAEIADAAAAMPAVCEECDRLRRQERAARDEELGYAIAALIALVALAVFLVVASMGLGFVSAIFALLALAAAAAVLGFGAASRQAGERAFALLQRREDCERRLQALRDSYDDALERIGTHCCMPCVFVPVVPAC